MQATVAPAGLAAPEKDEGGGRKDEGIPYAIDSGPVGIAHPPSFIPRRMKSALVLFAHGARDGQWSEPFRAIRQMVAEQRPDLTVELAFLELMRPALDDCVAELARTGHASIIIAPLFLAQGGHLKKDLPRLVEGYSTRYPSIQITVLPAIGEVAGLLNAISNWLVNSAPR